VEADRAAAELRERVTLPLNVAPSVGASFLQHDPDDIWFLHVQALTPMLFSILKSFKPIRA